MDEVILWSFFIVLVGLAVAALLILGLAPGWIAKSRGHPSWEAIRLCGFIGLLLWPCWLIALIWAYTGKASPPPREPDYHLGTPRRPPAAEAVRSALRDLAEGGPRQGESDESGREARALEVKSRRERAAERKRRLRE